MTLDTQVMFDVIRQQLHWLERELFMLREALKESPVQVKSLRTFESLRGIWAGVVFDDEDFQASRLKLPVDL